MFVEQAIDVKDPRFLLSPRPGVFPLGPATVTPPAENCLMSTCTVLTAPSEATFPSLGRGSRPDPRPIRLRAAATRAPVGSSRPVPASCRRRAAPAIAVVVCALVAVALGLGVGHASAATDPTRVVAPAVYVVQPGDTLWVIAGKVAPEVPTQRAVAVLRSSAGTASLLPGQRIVLPAQLR